MIKAVDRFDPERGFRLATYAMWWIRAQVQDYVLRSWSLVRVAKTASQQQKLFFNLRRLKAQLKAIDDGELSPGTARRIAGVLGVPVTNVIAMHQRLAGPDASLNLPLHDGDTEWQDWLVDERADQEASVAERESAFRRRTALRVALSTLTPRERDIVAARRLRDAPIAPTTLATRFAVTTERIRQIEYRAVEKLARLMRGTDQMCMRQDDSRDDGRQSTMARRQLNDLVAA